MDALGPRFERFLAAVEPDRAGQVIACEAITGGYSRVSARARVRWRDGTEEMFILRGDPPPGSGVFTSDRDAEWDLLAALPAATSVAVPVARSAPVLRYVTRWARAHRPPPVPPGLVHGDCQPSNVLVGPARPPLVIDWEFAHIGDPREDLGYYTQIPLEPNVYWADPERFLHRYRAATGLTEEQVNPRVVEYFLMIGMATLLEQLLVAAAAIGGAERPGIMAPYLINAISHQYDMFLAICDRLS